MPSTWKNAFWIVCTTLVALAGAWVPFALAATTVTDVYDLPSSMDGSALSNHKIVITTSENVEEGETLTISFESGFTTAAIIENDVDVSDDGIDLGTASSCAGGVDASVSMASSVLTITVCAGSGAAIASGSEVIVEIGTNASSSGTGANQITNPSASATYYITIAGTSGMTGSIPIPIGSESGSVSAVVPSSGGGSSGGGGGGGTGGDGGGESDTGSDTDTDTETPDTTETDPETEIDPETETDPEADTDTDTDAEEGDTTSGGDEEESGSSSDTGSGSGSGGDSGSGGASEDSSSGSGDGSAGEAVGTDSGDGAETDTSSGSVDHLPPATSVANESGAILLAEDGDAVVIPGTSVIVSVEIDDADAANAVSVVVGDTRYSLIETTLGTYSGLVETPSSDITVNVVVDYADGGSVTESYQWSVQSPGLVYEIIDGNRQPVVGSIVIVYERSGGLEYAWDAARYGQRNPVTVGQDGTFAWYVPNGTYVVTAAKSGYEDARVTVRVRDGVLAPLIELERTLVPVVEDDVEPEIPLTTIEAVREVTKNVTESVSQALETVNQVRALPEVQTAAEVARPATVAAAAAGVSVLATSFNFINYLRYLFTAPLLFFARRRKQKFGIVYNGITKVPVDLAIVRLLGEGGRIVQTRVSDPAGRFFFKVNPGLYTMVVAKGGYVFPSAYVQGGERDGSFEDVYTGGQLEVTADQVLLTPSIPVDPSDAQEFHAPKRLIRQRFLRVFQNILAVTGLVVALLVAFIQPTILSFTLVALHVFMYGATAVLTKRLGKQRGWGIVRTKEDQGAIPNTVVRLFEPKYNKLIESTLTDGKGRYAFMAGQNEYYVTYEKPGFDKAEVRPIDYTDKKEPELISVDVSLARAQET